ncbi:riboflavin transporter MCH5 [Fusarium phyllophilum]|uniref:Riboflavin transporter MCH5 n=1 Tax=Fusarium phyllophilum TaxID=47803 RepID=A0A8H5JTX3_9HYPO|nr:riboflavin transporter MCH5 [Fusarium phyllophilum]
MADQDNFIKLQDQALSDSSNNVNQEEKEVSGDPLDPSPAPDGGLQAWLVAAGSACIFFSCLGFANSFGVLQEYYMTHQLQGHSEDAIAWIGSISTFIQFAVGALSGPMFDRYGSWVLRPAAVMYFMLAQGILMGIAMAFLQIPAFAAVSHYFDKKRAAAFGIAV